MGSFSSPSSGSSYSPRRGRSPMGECYTPSSHTLQLSNILTKLERVEEIEANIKYKEEEMKELQDQLKKAKSDLNKVIEDLKPETKDKLGVLLGFKEPSLDELLKSGKSMTDANHILKDFKNGKDER